MTPNVSRGMFSVLTDMNAGMTLSTSLVTGNAWLRGYPGAPQSKPVHAGTFRALLRQELIEKRSERRLIRRWRPTGLGRAALRNGGEVSQPREMAPCLSR